MNVNTWHENVYECEQKGIGYVLITVIRAAGSTPRDNGTKMVVTGDSQFDTVGGGHLEFEAVQRAREMLAKGETCQDIISYPLSSKLGQCCGGAVKLLFEVMLDHQQHVAVFGAGHVAQALVPILAQLPLQIHWVESRENWLNKPERNTAFESSASGVDADANAPVNLAEAARRIASIYSNITPITNDAPVDVISVLPRNTWIIILTHNHQLDYELVEASLRHIDSDYIGMIGSKTKAKRFRTRLEHRGFNQEQIDRLISPIGDLNISGKRPVEVAVSISAQIMGLMQKVETVQTSKGIATVSDEKATENAANTSSNGGVS
ncbi:MAG: xanthine dehydrogenase accessory protein XdhC [Pseudomonadota bacterium]